MYNQISTKTVLARKKVNCWSIIALFFLSIFCSQLIFAQAIENTNTNSVSANVIEQIRRLVEDISESRKLIQNIDQQLVTAKLESDIKQLNDRKRTAQQYLKERLYTFEEISTGAVDLGLFEEASSENFNWQEELKDILKPALFELKKITEKPRQIEKLRSDKTAVQTRIEAAELAIKEIEALINAVDSKKIKQPLETLLKDWQQRRDNLRGEAQLIDFQLNEKVNSGESRSEAIANALKSFFTGRGLNLLLAFLAFLLTFIALRYISHLLERRISRGQDKEKRFAARLVHVIFQVLTVLLSLLVLMLTLYVLSDWLILTLLIIVLVGVAFALRNSLPRYIDEARLLLNIGAVREGERVIYNGLPWKVSRLNIYSDLVNPLLTGGRLRLPMSEMLQLISRRWSRNEPWFPCKPGDYIVMDDDTYGCVELQTPEQVQLKALGGSIKTYATTDFITRTPRNLSGGFGLFVSFGLDYGLQSTITTSVVGQLKEYLSNAFYESHYKEYLDVLDVEFDEAASSSLNMKIITLFSGDAAKEYFSLKRFIQSSAVEACNNQGWTIPFNQLTVHTDS